MTRPTRPRSQAGYVCECDEGAGGDGAGDPARLGVQVWVCEVEEREGRGVRRRGH